MITSLPGGRYSLNQPFFRQFVKCMAASDIRQNRRHRRRIHSVANSWKINFSSQKYLVNDQLLRFYVIDSVCRQFLHPRAKAAS